jgi:hypothetical protein
MAVVVVFAFSVVKVLDEGAEGAGESDFDAPSLKDAVATLGFGVGASVCDVETEGGCEGEGFGPPIFREIVGGGRGASVCSGRSKGAGGAGSR